MPRGNPQNLKPIKSTEEARTRGRKGGLKSGETRKKKKSMRETAKLLLSMGTTPKFATELRKLGVDEDEQTNQMAVLVQVMLQALKGDIKAAEFLRDTAGEAPKIAQFEMRQEATATATTPIHVYAVELPDNGRGGDSDVSD